MPTPRQSRGFILVWGRQNVVKQHGTTPKPMQCRSCRSINPMLVKSARPYFTLFFIPMIPLNGADSWLECPSCHKRFANPNQQFLAQSDSNTPALVGFILSIIAYPIFCLAPLLAIPALILGIVGIKKSRRPGGARGGLAIAAVCLASANIVLIIPIFLAILLPSFSRARELSNRSFEASEMRQVAQAMSAYARDNGGVLPPHIAALTSYLPSPKTLVGKTLGTAPLAAWPAGDWKTIAPEVDAHCDFVYVGADSRSTSESAAILLYSRDPHQNDGRNVAFGDGHVDFVRTANLPLVFDANNRLRARRGLTPIALDGPPPAPLTTPPQIAQTPPPPTPPLPPVHQFPVSPTPELAPRPARPNPIPANPIPANPIPANPVTPAPPPPPRIAMNVNPDDPLAVLSGNDESQKRFALMRLEPQTMSDDRKADAEKAIIPLLDNPSLRDDALRALKKFATRASEPAVLKMLPGTEPDGRESFQCNTAFEILTQIHDPACAPTVAKYVPFFFTRRSASQCLQSLGSAAEPAVAPLLSGGPKKDEQVIVEAAHILERIGTSKSQAALIDARSRVRGQPAKAAIQAALDHLAQRGSSPPRGR